MNIKGDLSYNFLLVTWACEPYEAKVSRTVLRAASGSKAYAMITGLTLLFIGVNITFFPQHFLGLNGMVPSYSLDIINIHCNNTSVLSTAGLCGAISLPIRSYPNAGALRSIIMKENRKKAIIYQWFCHITDKIYVGSAKNGHTRLRSYWQPSVLSKNAPIYNSLFIYTHNNHALYILEEVGHTDKIERSLLLEREQHYLNKIFSQFPRNMILNLSPTAGNNQGYSHTEEFKLQRTGILNPMYYRRKSIEFIAMQNRDKKGTNNPQYGVKKTRETIAKLTKPVFV